MSKLRRIKRLTTLSALAAGAVTALPAAAVADSCPGQPTSMPFAAWGDLRSYSLAPGGDFEGSLTWAGSGTAALYPQNDPFELGGSGTSSVQLEGSDSITSPSICVTELQPYMRFVARAQDRTSRLTLEVLWSDDGVAKTDTLEEHPADLWQGWAPSKLIPLGAKLPTGSGEVHQVKLRLRLKDNRGSWLVDNVFIDPTRRS